MVHEWRTVTDNLVCECSRTGQTTGCCPNLISLTHRIIAEFVVQPASSRRRFFNLVRCLLINLFYRILAYSEH
jgi:hypothetical protein